MKNRGTEIFGVAVLMKLIMIMHILTRQYAFSSSSTTNGTNRDVISLLALKSKMELPSNSKIVSSWNPNTSLCTNWIGVSCSLRHHRVTKLDLGMMELRGTISPNIGNLSFLRHLDLWNNSFYGPLPETIGWLRRLRYINLGLNQIVGTIPSSISKCHMLKKIYLRQNKFQGNIPQGIDELTNLEMLDIGYNSLTGTIPSSVFNVSSLRILALSFNQISVRIPIDMCHMLPNLEELYLSKNSLGGHILASLCFCRNLKNVELFKNGLVGSIPRCLGNISNLEYLVLENNFLSGEIPSELGKLSSLTILALDFNHLSGEIPSELGQLSKLRRLFLSNNNLSGWLPPTIFNLSSSRTIELSFNSLSGNVLEKHIHTSFRLPDLGELILGNNKFSGRIPDSVSNASMLTLLDLSYNYFTGPVPMTLGDLQHLKKLNMFYNELTNHPFQKELHFLTSLTRCTQLQSLGIGGNPLNGELPKSIGNFSTSLERFGAGGSQIQGNIPYQIGNLGGLLLLGLEENDLIGTIPSSTGNLLKLQELYLSGNKVEGNLPYEMCRLISLGTLHLHENNMSGPIPSCVGNLTELNEISLASNSFSSIPPTMWTLRNAWFMNLSVNSLFGHFPPEIGQMVKIQILDVSKNRLSASIPETISNLKMLEQLNMSDNAFQGNIPASVADLGSLKSLDLSSNNLSGTIPASLQKLRYLKSLNLSFNMLSGPVPAYGSFTNFTFQSFMGNHDLCGNSSKLKLPPCPYTIPSKPRKTLLWLKYVLSSIAALILVALLLILYLKCWRKSRKLSVSSKDLSLKLGHKYVSYYDLLSATDNLSEANLLGSGSFGSVYKGTMPDGELVAVKVFNLEIEGAVTSFDRECKVLRNVRHRNLVKIISSCSNLDFRALVLQYMPNGSLEKWLYNQGQNCLDVLQRMNIMIDVASGLEYLHHEYSEPIVHCDLKPSNILLDEDMVAHVADFGIAKILAKYKSMTQTATLGSMGYIAPEFGLQGRVSAKGDVYSYGVVLMETFTRKNPRDEMFNNEGLNLRQWVMSSYPNQVMQILDNGLWTSYAESTIDAAMDSLFSCFSSIFELALQCSSDIPEERLSMIEVVVRLKKLKHDMVQHLSRFNRQ